ncbi:hemin ABC transporter substrate-binding protein [Rhodoplanes sp. TEM]|uniref:Hemin ABC transporter substrate-binding protein n=1 Tax=Rhodoplanes tepidamans TaxID=200616 RepID=A0ABT5JDZ3_RHOTP|nr:MULTISPECIES: hemin ABC transporter substrate-binding protein [Rhodoplanes]MDC7787829.1 hemin ABC transporter substrate-binding protein [Rhodoplanes tepidamans]MDC7984501.1 hemin ABC transporter substrate-binding protein [Rhodoplanes sp. TEM]MDQ0357910.1 iron complex transport system substrate-binding protein [Rhodoplanes tepidamans]
MTRSRRAALRLMVTAALLSAAAAPVLAAGINVTDATGRSVTVTDARRIVSVGGSITEILYALGVEDRIVAVDTTSIHPARALKEKPNVGYMRQLSPEGILAMSPSLVLAIEGSGPPEAVAVLQAARVPFVQVPDRFTADGILDKIRLVAAAVGEATRGDCLAAAVKQEFDALAAQPRPSGRPPRILFVLSFVNDRAMVGGRDTAADGIIRMAGAENAMPDLVGYKLVGDEAIIAARPDVVLMMERPGQTVTPEAVLSRPAFAMTPAGVNKTFVSMNGQYLLGFGPRTALAVRDFAERIAAGTDAATTPKPVADAIAARHEAALGACLK